MAIKFLFLIGLVGTGSRWRAGIGYLPPGHSAAGKSGKTGILGADGEPDRGVDGRKLTEEEKANIARIDKEMRDKELGVDTSEEKVNTVEKQREDKPMSSQYQINKNKGIVEYTVEPDSDQMKPFDNFGGFGNLVENTRRPEKNGSLTLTRDQYSRLAKGEKVSTDTFTAKEGGKGNKIHVEYDLKDGAPTPYIFPHQSYSSRTINGVPAIQPYESSGNSRKLRIYEEGQTFKVNGVEQKAQAWAKHGRNWYPVNTFYNAYVHQPAIFVPPSM